MVWVKQYHELRTEMEILGLPMKVCWRKPIYKILCIHAEFSFLVVHLSKPDLFCAISPEIHLYVTTSTIL